MKANSSVLGNRAWHQMLGFATALAIVLANVATAAGPTAAGRQTKASPQGGGPREGIKVHGAWTIVVRNPDGTVALRREFENALAAGASAYLATTLARQGSVGYWRVDLYGALCLNASAAPVDCVVAEPDPFPTAPPNWSRTLSISAPQTGPDAGMFVLSGSTRATQAGTVTAVVTTISRCPATTAPATPCVNTAVFFFTHRTLSVGIPVVAGQTVDVTVKISFS